MCATFGDQADAEWYQKHGLPYRKVILPDGRMQEEIPFVRGMKIRAARAKMVELLGERGLLRRQEAISHMVAVHERCGREVEILPSNQWYIDVLSERERFQQATEADIRACTRAEQIRYSV